MIELLNHIGHLWWDWTASMFWQVGLLILLIGSIDRLIRRWAWPQWRYALWSLILVKLILPPSLSLPSGIVSELQPRVAQILRWVNVDRQYSLSDCGLRMADLSRSTSSQFDARAAADVERQPLIADEDAVNTDETLATNPQSEIMSPSALTGGRNPQLNWRFYALTIWFLGTLTLGTGFFLRLHRVAGRHAYEAAGASLPQSFYNHLADCAKRLGLRRIPRVIVTEWIRTIYLSVCIGSRSQRGGIAL